MKPFGLATSATDNGLPSTLGEEVTYDNWHRAVSFLVTEAFEMMSQEKMEPPLDGREESG